MRRLIRSVLLHFAAEGKDRDGEDESRVGDDDEKREEKVGPCIGDTGDGVLDEHCRVLEREYIHHFYHDVV